MKKVYTHIIVFACALLCAPVGSLWAQNATSSPSSRYGYGELNDNTPTLYRAMGGVSTGMRRGNAIDPSQPASYTACDSVSFMFDVAASAMWTHYKDISGARNRANGNLEYVTVQFPIWKQHIAMSAGVMPYSSVGYDFDLAGTAGNHAYTITYMGEGGVNQVYGGLSFNIVDWVALGANFYYMFGDATNIIDLSFKESSISEIMMYRNMHVSNFRFRYGAQFFHTFGRHGITLGAVFENKKSLRGSYVQYELSSLDSIRVEGSGFETPMYWSIGGSYNYNQRLLVALDYSMYAWQDANCFGQTNVLGNRGKWSVGVEWRNNLYSRKYVDAVMWRAGFSVMDSYVRSNDKKDFSVSAGVGLPLRTTASQINLTMEYTRRRSVENLNEDNLKLTVGVGVNENWFFKRKL